MNLKDSIRSKMADLKEAQELIRSIRYELTEIIERDDLSLEMAIGLDLVSMKIPINPGYRNHLREKYDPDYVPHYKKRVQPLVPIDEDEQRELRKLANIE